MAGLVLVGGKSSRDAGLGSLSLGWCWGKEGKKKGSFASSSFLGLRTHNLLCRGSFRNNLLCSRWGDKMLVRNGREMKKKKKKTHHCVSVRQGQQRRSMRMRWRGQKRGLQESPDRYCFSWTQGTRSRGCRPCCPSHSRSSRFAAAPLLSPVSFGVRRRRIRDEERKRKTNGFRGLDGSTLLVEGQTDRRT